MINQRKVGVILSYIQMLINIIISLVYTPIMLRLLGQNEYGIYQTAASIISYLNLLSLGFGSSYMRFFARYKAENNMKGLSSLNGLFFLVFSTAALFSLIAGIILAIFPQTVFGDNFTHSELLISQVLLVLMTVNIAVTFFDSIFSMYIGAHERFVFLRIWSIISTFIKPVVTLPILLLGYGSIGLTCVTTAVTLGTMIVDIVYAKKLGIKFSFRKPDFLLLKEITVFASFVFISTLANTINSTIDILILNRYYGPESVAVYEIGSRFNTYLMTFSVSISNVYVPKVNIMVAKNASNHDLTNLMIRIGRIQFYVITLIIGEFTLVGRYFIGIYAGTCYFEAYGIALLLMVSSFVPYIQNIGIEIQKAKNKHIFRSVTYLFIALINVLITIPCIKVWGIRGAAVGTAFALIVGNTILMNIYYKKQIGILIGEFWRSLIKPFFAVLTAFLPCFAFTRIWLIDCLERFIIIAVVYACTHIGAVYFIGSNESEKSLILSYIHKRR